MYGGARSNYNTSDVVSLKCRRIDNMRLFVCLFVCHSVHVDILLPVRAALGPDARACAVRAAAGHRALLPLPAHAPGNTHTLSHTPHTLTLTQHTSHILHTHIPHSPHTRTHPTHSSHSHTHIHPTHTQHTLMPV